MCWITIVAKAVLLEVLSVLLRSEHGTQVPAVTVVSTTIRRPHYCLWRIVSLSWMMMRIPGMVGHVVALD